MRQRIPYTPKPLRSSSETHSAVIISAEGERFVAFVDGIPDKCAHEWDGPSLISNNEGEYFNESDVSDDPMERERFYVINKISGGCVSCSKCGKPYQPDIWL